MCLLTFVRTICVNFCGEDRVMLTSFTSNTRVDGGRPFCFDFAILTRDMVMVVVSPYVCSVSGFLYPHILTTV